VYEQLVARHDEGLNVELDRNIAGSPDGIPEKTILPPSTSVRNAESARHRPRR
jgi:hypothetical protein